MLPAVCSHANVPAQRRQRISAPIKRPDTPALLDDFTRDLGGGRIALPRSRTRLRHGGFDDE